MALISDSVFEPNFADLLSSETSEDSIYCHDEPIQQDQQLLLPLPITSFPPSYPTALVQTTSGVANNSSTPLTIPSWETPLSDVKYGNNFASHNPLASQMNSAYGIHNSSQSLFQSQQSLLNYQQQMMSGLQQTQLYQQQPQMFNQQPFIPQFHPSNFVSPLNKKSRSGSEASRRVTLSTPRVQSTHHAPKGNLYEATYSNIEVYELTVEDNSVMRRRSDGWVNGTHILKVAGVEKGRRTKILEKEVHHERHEKIQGGYGKYQGTWVPVERARTLAHDFGVGEVLAPILDIP